MESGDPQHVPAVTHPLQDIELPMDADAHDDDDDADGIISEKQQQQQQQQQQTTRSKENWVKFDDDANGVGASERDDGKGNNKAHDRTDSAIDSGTATPAVGIALSQPPSTTTTSTTTTTTRMNSTNRLSPIPPPTASARTHTNARARTPSESSGQQQSQLAAPVQRSAVSSTTGPASPIPDVAPAVLTTESTHVNLNASGRSQLQLQHQHQHQKPKASPHSPSNGSAASSGPGKPTSVALPIESAPAMRTIELSTGRVREGFANGDVIVTLLPANTKWPWITPAIFRPELVPEELMAQGLTLTVEEYVAAMETLLTDYRFTVYNICYKRILVCWIFFAFSVLLTLLFSGLQGVALFSLGVGWLFLNAAAIFLCMWVKLRLSRGLEKCLARVNKQLMKHKILLVLDDRGRISCHKVNLCFLYFDAEPCVSYLNEFLEQTEQQHGPDVIKAGWEAKLDIDLNDIIIQGNNPVRLSRKQALAHELFLSYLQRWGKDFLRRRLDWTVQEAGVHEQPRHLQSSICPCQYEEEVLRNKLKIYLQKRKCCGLSPGFCWL